MGFTQRLLCSTVAPFWGSILESPISNFKKELHWSLWVLMDVQSLELACRKPQMAGILTVKQNRLATACDRSPQLRIPFTRLACLGKVYLKNPKALLVVSL